MLDDKFREWLRNLRKREPAFTQEVIADASGVVQKMISERVTPGSTMEIPLKVLEGVSELLGYPTWIVLWAVETDQPLPPLYPRERKPRKPRKRKNGKLPTDPSALAP